MQRLAVEGIKTRLHKSVDCDTKNIIYMIGCQVCSKKYIGETQQKLYLHFNQIHNAKHLFITILEKQ